MALADQVREAGVVGAGGAGFPTHVKVGSRVDTIIANGAECEPVLVTDQWVMHCRAGEVAQALRAEAAAVGAGRVVLALKKKYHAQIDRFQPLLDGLPPIELFLLDDVYPSGDEQFLVHEVTGRVVPEGGIPLEVGVLVQNVATLSNISDAMTGRPVILKHVTVAGEVRRPGVYIAPIGTTAAEVIAAAGGATVDPFRVIDGGPMMGTVLVNLETTVVKTTSGYIVLPAGTGVIGRLSTTSSSEFQRGMAACCQCRMCTDLCPRYLLGHRIRPHLAMRAILAGTTDAPETLAMGYLCCMCGVCEAYACPLTLSPRRVFGAFKERLAAAKMPNPYRARPEGPREEQRWTRVPKHRLTERLGLGPYVPPGTGQPERIPDPWEVRIPLKQHVGAPAAPVVKPGDAVKAGDLIGEIPAGALGARVHASIEGRVVSVGPKEIVISRT